MGEIQDRYKALEIKRGRALQEAQDAERYMPYMGMEEENEAASRVIYTSSLRRGAALLQSIVHQALFPVNVKWYRMASGFGTNVDEKLQKAYDDGESLLERFFMQIGYYSRVFPAIMQCIGAGISLLHFKADGLRVIPLSRFVVQRIDGQVRRIIFYADVEHKLAGSTPRDIDRMAKLYTEIDFDKDIVRQERSDVGKVVTVKVWKPSDFVLAEAGDPQSDGYPRGAVWHIMPDVNACDVFERAMAEIAELASRILWFLDTARTSGLSTSDVTDAPNGTVFAGEASCLTAVTAGVKIQDWNLVAQEKAAKEKIIGEVMGAGLAEQVRAAKSATAARIIAAAVDAQLHGLVSNLSSTLLRRSCIAAMSVTGLRVADHLDKASMKAAGMSDAQIKELSAAFSLQVHVLTGPDAFSREAESEQGLELVDFFLQRFEGFKARIDEVALFKEAAAARRLGVTRFLRDVPASVAGGGVPPAAAMAAAAGGGAVVTK